MENNRILWIDTAKFIGIFLVIFVHTLTGVAHLCDIYIRQYIHLFFMQLFFIISGYLYKDKTFDDNLQKIIFGLFIPYFIYQFICLPFVVGYNVIHEVPFITALWKCLLGIFVVGSGIPNETFFLRVCPTVWFIVTLIEIRFLFLFIKPTLKNFIVISSLCFLITKILVHININLFFCFGNLILAIPFFALGNIIHKNLPSFKNQYCYSIKNCIQVFCSTLIFGFLLFQILKINGYSVMGNAILDLQDKSYFLVYFGACLGSLTVINICKLINKTTIFIQTISENTLFIIFYHWLLLFFMGWFKVRYILNILPNIFIIQILFVFFLSILNLIICYYTIILLKNYPLILGKYKPKQLIKRNNK